MSDANEPCCSSGRIPVVDSRWRLRDTLGAIRVRLGSRRNTYRVEPGLYCIGNPVDSSAVLVTANYKLSFDHLRKHLTGRDVWILVLNTFGINVWCAAGKGTFGTDEVVRMIEKVKLGSVVRHRNLILPQLAAPGVSAHEVRKQSGFRVCYGPVRAQDLPKYLDRGMKKTEEMRTVRFSLTDRLVLVPVEVTGNLLLSAAVIAFAAFAGFLSGRSFPALLEYGGIATGGLITGTVLVPALLPVMKFRSFTLKGVLPGLLWTAVAGFSFSLPPAALAGFLLLVPALSGYLALQFTGATVYTSQTGTQYEVRRALPPLAVCAGAGSLLLLTSSLLGGV